MKNKRKNIRNAKKILEKKIKFFETKIKKKMHLYKITELSTVPANVSVQY